jgi:tRNA pseudouridine synthase 10
MLLDSSNRTLYDPLTQFIDTWHLTEHDKVHVGISVPAEILTRQHVFAFTLSRRSGVIFTGWVDIRDCFRFLISTMLPTTALHADATIKAVLSVTLPGLAETESLTAAKRRLDAASNPPDFAYLPWAHPTSDDSNSLAHYAVEFSAESMPVYVCGSYLKLSRDVSQSPSEILAERSIQDILADALRTTIPHALDEAEFALSAAGREDVDVRMLGNGRPFVLTLRNMRLKRLFTDAELAQVSRLLASANDPPVLVHSPHIGSESSMAAIKESETTHAKRYRCVVYTAVPFAQSELDAILSTVHDLAVLQDTPIRVMHRRTVATRPKTLHKVHAQLFPGFLSTATAKSHWCLVDLECGSGMYVKEWVHGDFGRTRPSLGDLLGCKTSILQLDVLDLV